MRYYYKNCFRDSAGSCGLPDQSSELLEKPHKSNGESVDDGNCCTANNDDASTAKSLTASNLKLASLGVPEYEVHSLTVT